MIDPSRDWSSGWHRFVRGVFRARRMRRTNHDYWAGYSIGLLNGYSERGAIPPALHSWLWAQPDLHTRALGYRAGFRFMTQCVTDTMDPGGGRD